MNNIKRIADALITWRGEKAVVSLQEAIYIQKDQRKIPLIKKSLDEKELAQLNQELEAFTAGADHFVIEDNRLAVEKKADGFSIILNPSPGYDQSAQTVEIQENKPEDQAEKNRPPAARLEDQLGAVLEKGDTQTIDGLLKIMVGLKASDLHLSSNCPPYLRIDGDMVLLAEVPGIPSGSLWERLQQVTPKRNQEEFNTSKDTDFTHEIKGLGRFRCNIFLDHRGVGAVFRFIPSEILSTETLKVPQAIIDLCSMPKGLILVTGPTGSGKSTTLAALIDHVNKTQKKHIITIEDPVEFVHENKLSLVNQREVHSHTQSFKKALRAALREDPDIILVGEMRDLETIAIAIEMAVTGHLVLGTLHTSTAVATVERIIDQFPPDQQAQIRTMLSDALIGVVSQMLLKRKEGGRVAAYEVLISNIAVSNLIREGKTYQIPTIMQTGKKYGQQMINTHLSQLVNSGLVNAEEALDKAIDKENLRIMLKSEPG